MFVSCTFSMLLCFVAAELVAVCTFYTLISYLKNKMYFGAIFFFIINFTCLVFITLSSINIFDGARGSLRSEDDLKENIKYQVVYASQEMLDSDMGYLVVIEEKFSNSDKNAKPLVRTYGMKQKPPSAFYVTKIGGKVVYLDADKVR